MHLFAKPVNVSPPKEWLFAPAFLSSVLPFYLIFSNKKIKKIKTFELGDIKYLSCC